jgi:hemolysin activation/secretion protein
MLAAGAAAATNTAAAVKTNASPRFVVRAYEIRGDTLLSTNTLMSIFAKRTGTNVALSDITQAASDLQMEYRNRGYPTVNVTIPPQQLTNGIVKIRVFQGRLSEILVTQNRYFSSNNVMRTLPSLRTNMILHSAIFQAELDRANANQDRQIYPRLEPGLEENTTALRLTVNDRLPLHAKVDFNNQSSPGTPELRLNTSVSYQNLWQLEHSVGVQYSFSPESYKTGELWNFYDQPLVANYSAFYRLPLGNPEAVAQTVATQPENFGYDEASRKFRLPPASGRPELNFYASRSTIDTGLETTPPDTLLQTTSRTITKYDEQEDLTVNEDLGFRFSDPLRPFQGVSPVLSFGFDYKHYNVVSSKTYVYTFTEILHHSPGDAGYTQVGNLLSPVAPTEQGMCYAPISPRLDLSRPDRYGITTFGLGISANTWYSGSASNLQSISRSATSSGHWVILNPSLSRDLIVYTNWVLSLRADGQWASEPLISNEQFGVGGLAGVRGYHEGEVFGDTGWRITLEQKTPTCLIGMAYAKHPLRVRGSVYMDYGEVYLLDPQGRQDRTRLWGTGFGGIATIGATWEARLLFSWPLLSAGTVLADQPRLDFSLSAQF